MKISDICKTAAGGTPLKSNKKFYEGGNIPWLLSGEVGNRDIRETKKFITQEGLDGSSAKIFPVNTVLIAMYGATAGEVGILRCEAATNQAVCGIYPNDKVLPEYLYYFFLDHKDKLVAQAVGNAQPNISQQKIKNTEIPLPPPPEQKRIVAILDQAFADIEQARAKTEQNLKNARELFESYLQQVFSQRGEGWVETTLENLITDDCSLSYGIVQPGDDVNGGMPIVRPTDMKKELINLDGLKLIDPSKAEGYKRTSLQGGELLVCVRGTTGTTSIACESLVGANVTRGIVPVRFDPQKISDRFGYYQFISPLIQRQIKAATYGAALMQINIRDFRKIKVCVPPLEVQTVLSDRLDGIRPDLIRIEKIYKLKLSAFDELKKSILQKAFSGELTKTLEGGANKGAVA